MDKEEVIKILKEISVLLELKDENSFKIRAYQNASRALEASEIDFSSDKKIKDLFDNLGISNIGQLEYACIENILVDLPNFGKKTQENILKGIEILKKFQGKFLFANIIEEAESIHRKIQDSKYVKRSSLAGSVRRKKEIVKDIDIVASTGNSSEVMDFFTSIKEAKDIIARGDTKSSIRLK